MHNTPLAAYARLRSFRPVLLLTLLLVLLAALIPIGTQGITSALHTFREHQRVTARVSALRAENAHLRRITARLRDDLAIIEADAREEPGLVPREAAFLLPPRETGLPLRASSRDSAPLRRSARR